MTKPIYSALSQTSSPANAQIDAAAYFRRWLQTRENSDAFGRFVSAWLWQEFRDWVLATASEQINRGQTPCIVLTPEIEATLMKTLRKGELEETAEG